MLRAYLVDDEPLARDELKYLLKRTKQVDVVGENDCIENAFEEIVATQPDLVFLDIELAGENGLTLAKQVENLQKIPFIIFATAYDEYALQAFESNAIDYLLKPFDEKRIQKTIDKINKINRLTTIEVPLQPLNRKVNKDKIALIVDEKIVLIQNEDIVYVETSEGKCTVATIEQTYIVGDTLVVLEKRLDSSKFLRVHRSYLANIDHIIEIEPWFNSTYNLLMRDGSKVPVSRTYVKELKQLFQF
ncbi:LytR/AlgR family response regulator transcription factor [Bacillus sp. JJ1562]|uniref:LytR/AlgR family response regulator transcription factor n=1 Tax=Bacillus sp. JJ1562 TaxID=3122960 RepID=UPI003002F70B